MYYILKDKKPVEVDMMEWAHWASNGSKAVASDCIEGGIRVSTVFLGLDHRYGEIPGPPILFETMIFGGMNDGYQDRYCTWEEAEEGHKEALKLAKESIEQQEQKHKA